MTSLSLSRHHFLASLHISRFLHYFNPCPSSLIPPLSLSNTALHRLPILQRETRLESTIRHRTFLLAHTKLLPKCAEPGAPSFFILLGPHFHLVIFFFLHWIPSRLDHPNRLASPLTHSHTRLLAHTHASKVKKRIPSSFCCSYPYSCAHPLPCPAHPLSASTSACSLSFGPLWRTSPGSPPCRTHPSLNRIQSCFQTQPTKT